MERSATDLGCRIELLFNGIGIEVRAFTYELSDCAWHHGRRSLKAADVDSARSPRFGLLGTGKTTSVTVIPVGWCSLVYGLKGCSNTSLTFTLAMLHIGPGQCMWGLQVEARTANEKHAF